eukprot:8791121-Ditylum_brightwellii.AAC.1
MPTRRSTQKCCDKQVLHNVPPDTAFPCRNCSPANFYMNELFNISLSLFCAASKILFIDDVTMTFPVNCSNCSIFIHYRRALYDAKVVAQKALKEAKR